MAFNEVEAAKLIDEGKISDAEIKLLTRTRDGVSFDAVKDDKELNVLLDKGLVTLVDLSHPRANVSVQAVIPTEPGTTVLNLFDKRYRENTGADVDANTAPGADPKLVKAPTEEEARKVPSLETKPLTDKQKDIKTPADKTGAKDALKK